MKTRSRILCSAAIVSAISLIGCDNTVVGSPVYLGVIISPRPASIPAGGTLVFTGTVSNNLSLPQWSLLDASDTANPGTLTSVAGSSTSILYTAPPAPPIYSTTPTDITQGTVTLDVTVSPPAGTSTPVTSDSVTFVITAPTVTVGLSPAAATVALGATQQFLGYAVGNLNNTLTWQVNGVAGGSTSTGFINSSGLYMAPATMPMSGNTVTITIVSQADPTRSASAVITLQ